jgi:uncharacterized protein
VLMAAQNRLRGLAGQPKPHRAARLFRLAVFVCGLYGGYFNAAMGVLLMAGLALVLDETLQRISALKNVFSAVVGLTTVLVYSVFGPVNWAAVAVLAPATVVGGFAGARLTRRLPSEVLRWTIVVFAITVAVVLLVNR